MHTATMYPVSRRGIQSERLVAFSPVRPKWAIRQSAAAWWQTVPLACNRPFGPHLERKLPGGGGGATISACGRLHPATRYFRPALVETSFSCAFSEPHSRIGMGL